MPNLIEGLHQQMSRVREIITEYDAFPGGALAASIMRSSIRRAECAIENGDTVAMVAAHQDLEGYTM